MLEGVRFLWTATRGHRLRPWRSEYLKWRLETFTGKHAERLGRGISGSSWWVSGGSCCGFWDGWRRCGRWREEA